MWSLGHFTPPHSHPSSMLSLCVTAALLLPLCCGTTTDAQHDDEVTPTTDYPDYTFDYFGNSTFSYEFYEILSETNETHVKALGSNVNKLASKTAHGFYAVLLGLTIQQFCQQI
ncbi:hypothetical protein MHYP_G00027650 [Metynnis hypsauchen]